MHVSGSRTPSKNAEQELDRALDSGGMSDLPPNQPKGILGERGFDLYKIDEFEPDLNAGISQENDLPVVWLAIILSYLLFFPLAFWLVWRSALLTRTSKIVITAVGVVGIVIVILALAIR